MTRPPPRTIHFVSLGCPKNRVDTEVMLGVSDRAGYQLVAEPSDAEVIVVNTCGFVDAAKQESIDTILGLSDFKQNGRCKKLVVAGCLSQRYPEALARDMPEVDHFLGSSDMLKLETVLRADAAHPTERVLVGNPADYVYRQGDPRKLSSAAHSVYVKIAEGCSRSCSFCAIPSFRGKQRSRSIADVVHEVQELCATGSVEINLISQDTISYGRDLTPRTDLPALVRALLEVKELRWLRLFYLYPEKLDEELVELLAAGGKLVPYLDMPFQHASDRMLKLMRRGYDARRQRELIERLRLAVPNLFIRSAFIVGHPGETDQDFTELLELLRFAELDHVGVFRYSHEDGTHSGSMQDLIDDQIIDRRANALMKAQRAISKQRLRAMIGREVDVLIEGESDESEHLLVGRHAGQAPEIDGAVHLVNGSPKPGEIRKARITHAADYDLVGDLSLGTDDPLRPNAPNAPKAPKAKGTKGTRLRVVS
ncbi:MAG TPA: 30S ribosomal protein S12 methylthiotransferase RimO [Polyangiales bacterium]